MKSMKEVMEALLAGKKVRNEVWFTKNYYYHLKDGDLYFCHEPRSRLEFHHGSTWEVCEEKSIIPFTELPVGKVAKFNVENDVYLVKISVEGRPKCMSHFDLIQFHIKDHSFCAGGSYPGLMVEYPLS